MATSRKPRPRSRRVAPAIHANKAVERWYRDKLQCQLLAMHDSLVLHLRAAWKEADPSISFGFAQDAPSPSILLRSALRKWGGLWERKLNKLGKTLADGFGKRATRSTDMAMMASLKDAGFTVQFKPTMQSIQAYQAVVAENVGLIKSIPQQYLKDVQTSVWTNVLRGGDLDQLSKDLRENYGVSYRRAALIARDQNNKAKAVFEESRRQQLGITEAIWQHSGGGKEPRPTHVKAGRDAVVYQIKEGWYDPAVKKNIWPGTEINCRCTSRAVIPEFG